MIEYPPESQRFNEDFSGEPSYWPVDRRAEADRFLEKIDKHPGKPVFVHGRRDVGKTSLLAYHVTRRLAERGDNRVVKFGRLQIDGAASIEIDEPGSSIEEMVKQDCIVCVDQFHHLFVLPAYEQLKFLDRLHAQIKSMDCVAAVVFLLDDDEIGDLMALNALRPDFVDVMFQVRSVDVIDSVRQILNDVAGTADWLPGDVLERIAGDAVQLLPDPTLGISPRFPAIVASRLIKVHAEGPDEDFSASRYIEGGHLHGLLESYVTSEFDRLAEAGLATVESLWRVMDEMVIADPVGGVLDLDALAARLDVTSSNCREILEAVRKQSGIIRKIGTGAYRPAPSQLHTVLRSLTRERRQKMGQLQAEVSDHAEAGLAHGTALPMAILKRVIRNQYDLRLSQRATQFVLDWVLRTRYCSMGNARYWLGRIQDDELRLDIVTSSAFDPDKDARLKGTKLLLEYGVPESTEILLNLVIQDPEPDVRASAIEQLATTASDSTREKLYTAARIQGSEYRINAVRALVIYPDEATVELLTEISRIEDKPKLARAAMDVLAGIPTDEAVSGLAAIALQSDIAERRQSAGAAMRRISQNEHIHKAVNAIFGWQGRERERTSWTAAIGRLGKATGSFFLGLAAIYLNFFVPGIVLLLIRQFRSGVLFCLLGIITYAEVVTPVSYMMSEILFGIRLFLFVASLIWTGSVLLRSGSQFIWRFGDLQHIVRVLVIAVLVFTVFIWDWMFLASEALFPAPHGIFHLMIQKWRRAARILSLQLLAFGFWFVGEYQSGIIYHDAPAWFGFSEAELNSFGSQVYLGIWYALFIGTFLWDVIGALLGRLFFAGWISRRRRRKELISVLLTERAYVDFLVSEVCADNRRAAGRAARLLIANGDRIPPDYLLHHADTDNKKLRRTLEKSLAKANSLSAVSQLAESMPAEAGLRQTIIVRALANRPTPQSLQALKEHSADVAPKERRRLYVGNSKYAASLLTTPLGVTATVMSFWVAFLIWEGSKTLLDPYRPIEKYVLRNCDELLWPSLAGYDPNRQIAWAMKRASTASNMAELMLEGGIEADRIEETEVTLEHVHARQCEESGDDAVLLIRLAALGGLAHLARRHPAGHQDLPDLDTDPAITIRRGLDNPRQEIRSAAITALSKLSDLQQSMAQFDRVQQTQISELLGRQLSDRNLAIADRQSVVDLLRIFGGTTAIESLKRFVLDSDSTFSGSRQRSASLAGGIRSGLGISGQLRMDAALALQSIQAMADVCTPMAQESLLEIAVTKQGNLGESAERALERDCVAMARPALDSAQPTSIGQEVTALEDTFGQGDYETVAATAEHMLEDTELAAGDSDDFVDLLLLAGRANYQLSLTDPTLTPNYWGESETYLDSYYETQLQKGAEFNADAIHELAQSRLGLARIHMDAGWAEGKTPAERHDEFEHAREYLDKITEDRFLQLFRSVDGERYDQVMSLVWAFNAAAVIDGWQDYPEALRLLQLSLESNDQFAWAYYLQSLSRYNLGDHAGALADSKTSLNLDPYYELPYRLIYQLRMEIDALAELTELKNSFEYVPWPNFYLAVLHHEYLAPIAPGKSALKEFDHAFDEMTLYVDKLDTINDPLVNIQWLELAITSGNLDNEEIRKVREILRKQSVGLGKVEIVASYFLALAVLHQPRVDTALQAAQQGDPAEVIFLDELLRAYRSLPDGSDALWDSSGIRHYVRHCREWGSCDIDESLAAEFIRIAEVFEQVKTVESTAALERSVETMKQQQGAAITPKPPLPLKPSPTD